MKTIGLTQGKRTLMDDEDFERLSKHSWTAIQINCNWYAISKRNYKNYYMHREVMNAKKGEYVDHRDHSTLDNRKTNLRLCSPAENARNAKKRLHVSSICKGVFWCKALKKWRSIIMCNYKNIHLGYFENEDDAARAYNEAAIKYFGEFALLNVIRRNR